MADLACIPSGPAEAPSKTWRETWTTAFDNEVIGLEIVHLSDGECIATDISSQREIGRGFGLAGVCHAVARFYLSQPLANVIQALGEVGSRAL